MKKLFLLMIMGLLTLSSFSQSGTTAYGFRPVMVVPDTSYKFPTVCKIGDLVWVSSTHQMYQLAVGVGISKNMNWVLASPARYHYPATTTLSDITTTGAATVGTTLTINGQVLSADHVNDLKASNSITATDTVFAPIVSATTGYILGTQIMTVKNTNGVSYNNSITATDTVFAPVLYSATNVNIAGTLTGSTSVRDTANFGTDSNGDRNKYIRKKITGVTAGDRFIVVPVMASTTATPGTAEFLGYYCTTDSLIISRNTASTSGLKVA